MNIKTKTVDVKADGDGYIVGYASTWTREPDAYNDIVAKGAFAESIERIKAEGKAIPLLWNHDSGDIDAYIGKVDRLEEDDHGLLFGAAFDSTDTAQRARELSKDGRLCSFSFAYDVLDQGPVELEDGREVNELRKLNLHEVSLTLYPANRDTSVVEVKSDSGTVGITGIGRLDKTDMDLIAKSLQAHFDACAKAGRRNSAKDADDLNRISELCSSIQSIVNGLLADVREEPDEQESEPEADEAKANAEEPDTANAEEPEAKSAEVSESLKNRIEAITKGEF